MKKYLSAIERDNLAVLIQMAGHTLSIISAWQNNLTASEKKYLRSAVTLVDKACKEIIERVDKKDALLVKKTLVGTRVCLLPNWEFEQKMKEYKAKMPTETCSVNLDALRDMASMSLETTCRGCNQDHATCKYKKAYQELEIPYYDDTADGCPYRM